MISWGIVTAENRAEWQRHYAPNQISMYRDAKEQKRRRIGPFPSRQPHIPNTKSGARTRTRAARTSPILSTSLERASGQYGPPGGQKPVEKRLGPIDLKVAAFPGDPVKC